MPLQRLAPTLTFVLLALLAAPAAGQGAPTISAVEPASGTEGDEFLVSGTGFGTKLPKLFFAAGAEKVQGTRLKVLEFVEPEGGEEPQLRVRVDRAIAGSFQLGVQVKGKLPVVSDTLFEIVPPEVTSFEPFLASSDELYELEVDHATTAGARVYVGTRRAKIVSFTPLGGDASSVIVRLPKLADANWDVTFRSRVGQSVLHQALEIDDSNVAKLGPQVMQWTLGGAAERSRGGKLFQAATSFGLLRFTGKARQGSETLRMIVEIPESALENFTEPTVLTAFSSGALIIRTPPVGETVVYMSDDFTGPDVHSVFLNAVTEKQIAVSFFSTVFKAQPGEPGPDQYEVEGSFVIQRK